MRAFGIGVLLCGLAGSAAAQRHEVITAPGALAGLPFSAATRVGNVLYLSGQIGNLPGTRQLADTSVAGQTRQTLENIKAVLAHAGAGSFGK